MSLKVLLADDHQIVRQGFRAILERDGFTVVGEASNGQEAVQLARELRPDVAVLDVAMPLLNGIDAARRIAKESPATRVVLLTMFNEDHHVLDALRAGVRGYLLKTRAVEDLEHAIREVCRGGLHYSGGVSKDLLEAYLSRGSTARESMTTRERQVLQLIAEGKTTKEVATCLSISVKTAESHRTHLMTKLDIHDVAGLVRYAIRHGLVQP